MKRTVMTLIVLSLAACGVGVEDEQAQAETSQQELVFVPNHTITSPRDAASGIPTGKR